MLEVGLIQGYRDTLVLGNYRTWRLFFGDILRRDCLETIVGTLHPSTLNQVGNEMKGRRQVYFGRPPSGKQGTILFRESSTRIRTAHCNCLTPPRRGAMLTDSSALIKGCREFLRLLEFMASSEVCLPFRLNRTSFP